MFDIVADGLTSLWPIPPELWIVANVNDDVLGPEQLAIVRGHEAESLFGKEQLVDFARGHACLGARTTSL